MYDMYPEWGPAQHDPEHPLNGGTSSASNRASYGALQMSLDLRDNGGERPDDN
jgi:hypothetical protein